MKTFLIDADDTLWENNIYFEGARDEFLSWMEVMGYRAAAVQEVFDRLEKANILKNGYGAENFILSLKETYLQFRALTEYGATDPRPSDDESRRGLQRAAKYGSKLGEPPPDEGLARIDDMAQTVRSHPIQLLGGVRESLEALCQRHRAILFTKGDPNEQKRKIQASGLTSCFSAIEIVSEKNIAAFEEVVQRHQLAKPLTWMVGNSPKSDVNPAVAAGLKAFYIPHAWTWEREREELCVSDRVTVLERFSDLLRYL